MLLLRLGREKMREAFVVAVLRKRFGKLGGMVGPGREQRRRVGDEHGVRAGIDGVVECVVPDWMSRFNTSIPDRMRFWSIPAFWMNRNSLLIYVLFCEAVAI